MTQQRKLTPGKAAKKLADIIERHLESLPEPERNAKLAGFHETVANVLGTRAKRARLPKTRVTRLSAQRAG